MKRSSLLPLFVCVIAIAACRTSAPSTPTTSTTQAVAAPSVSPLASTSKSAVQTESTPSPAVVAPPKTPAPNRDPKGERDVATYIKRLESPGRVADLQVDLVVKKLKLSDDAVVGDLGSGPGVFSIAFAKACPEGVVFAADIEPGQLDAVSAHAADAHVRNIVPVLCSTNDPHFPLARLDLVFIGDTYHHLEDRVAYMKRLKDVFKPGGRLALLEYKPGDLPIGPPAAHKLPAGVMEHELVEAGYVRVETFDTHPWHDFEVWRVVEPWETK